MALSNRVKTHCGWQAALFLHFAAAGNLLAHGL